MVDPRSIPTRPCLVASVPNIHPVARNQVSSQIVVVVQVWLAQQMVDRDEIKPPRQRVLEHDECGRVNAWQRGCVRVHSQQNCRGDVETVKLHVPHWEVGQRTRNAQQTKHAQPPDAIHHCVCVCVCGEIHARKQHVLGEMKSNVY